MSSRESARSAGQWYSPAGQGLGTIHLAGADEEREESAAQVRPPHELCQLFKPDPLLKGQRLVGGDDFRREPLVPGVGPTTVWAVALQAREGTDDVPGPDSNPTDAGLVTPRSRGVTSGECALIRRKLIRFGLGPSDQWDLRRLDRAGQLAVPQLFRIQDTEEIAAFSEAEVEQLLGYMIWDDSHEDRYITEQPLEGSRKRATWRSEYSTPDLKAHLAEERYYGVKRGKMTRMIAVDHDRHRQSVNGGEHVVKALKVGEVLKGSFPARRSWPGQP